MESRLTFDDAGQLLCPHCGHHYLHQGTVSIYSRSEDSPTVVLTTVTPDSAEHRTQTNVTISSNKGNPSLRRHGVVIRFNCEECPQPSELTIAQHKGTTEIGWRSTRGE